MAKYNLETRYSVVGLVEHFDTSLAVMEQYLPGEIYIVAKKINSRYLFIQWKATDIFFTHGGIKSFKEIVLKRRSKLNEFSLNDVRHSLDEC